MREREKAREGDQERLAEKGEKGAKESQGESAKEENAKPREQSSITLKAVALKSKISSGQS